MALLELEAVARHFPMAGGAWPWRRTSVRAVDGVSIRVEEGRTLGIVGESGCGKSTLARVIAGLDAPSAGTVRYRDQIINSIHGARYQGVRGEIQVVFQDPYASLNPRLSVLDALAEPVRNFTPTGLRSITEFVGALLVSVGLPESAMYKYPHQFSGGQRQRICIARALASDPRLVVADEPVSALDVSVQAQIVNLLIELQSSRRMSMVFVSHDIAVVREISDDIVVMYLGEIIESGPAQAVLANPLHPYTQALKATTPVADPSLGPIEVAALGEMPSARNPPAGCRFHTRCPHARSDCIEFKPALRQTDGERLVACHFAEGLAAASSS